ncbi:MAG: EVE domain-containing protein [Bdellovibrionota bacterium]
MKSYWLFKTEPSTYSMDDLVRDRKTAWSGIRNYQARNFLREVTPDDEILIYHTGDEKRVVGHARALGSAYPESTPDGADWVQVEIQAKGPLPRPVPLQQMKTDPALTDLLLFKNGRLSVIPLSKEQFHAVLALAEISI